MLDYLPIRLFIHGLKFHSPDSGIRIKSDHGAKGNWKCKPIIFRTTKESKSTKLLSNGDRLLSAYDRITILISKDFIKTFDLFKDKKITAEGRYQTAFLLTQYIDITSQIYTFYIIN